MKSSSKKLMMIAAAALLTVAAVILIKGVTGGKKLVLSDRETGRIYARYAINEDDVFSVSFIHSVNQSEVIDYYKCDKDGKILCFANRFHSFGAGMPESWPEGAVVQTTDDGILVSNLNIVFDDMTYIVGTVSDHILNINGRDISLRELCGKNSEVTFKIK